MAETGIMNTVQGGLGTGVQPKDSSNAPGPNPSAGAQTAINSIPPGMSPPAQGGGAPTNAPQAPQASPVQSSPSSQASPQKKGDIESEVDAMLKPEASDVHKQLDDILGKDDGEPANTPLGFLKGGLVDELNNFKSQIRLGAARNQKEEMTGLKQVWGDNIKITDSGQVSVRSSADGNWKKFGSIDEFANFSTPLMNFVIRQIPKVPGVMAQMGSQIAGAAVGGAVGNVPGAVAGGAAGGIVGSKLSQIADQEVSRYLGQSDPSFQYHNSIANLAIQGTLGGVAGGFQRQASVAANALLSSKLGDEAAQAVTNMPEAEAGFAKFASALKTFRNVFVPEVSQKAEGAAQAAMNGADASMNELGSKIGALKQDLAQLQNSKDKWLNPKNFKSFVQDELGRHGVDFDTVSGASNASNSSGTLPRGSSTLMQLYDEANTASFDHSNSGYGPTDVGKGMTVGRAQDFLDTIEQIAYKENTMNKGAVSDTENLYRGARAALNSDYMAHASELFQGEQGAPYDLFKNAMGNYSDKIDSYKRVATMFDTPEKISLMGKKLSAQGSPQALQAMNDWEAILGKNSDQYQNLRSEVLDRFIDNAVKDGRVNPQAISGYFRNPDNADMLEKLIPDKQARGVLNSILQQGEQLKKASELKTAQKVLVDTAVDKLGEFIPGGKLLKLLGKSSDYNKEVIDYTSDKLLGAVQEAVGPEQRNRMLDQLNAIDDFKSKAKLVDIEIPGAGRVRKYAPAGVPAALNAIERGGPSNQAGQTTPGYPGPQAPPSPAQP